MYSFNIILTEICNANCSHCYMSDKGRTKTLTKDEIKKIINNLPKNTKSIVFTGGEILLVLELLEYSLKLVKKKFNDIVIGLESNGIILYKDYEKAKDILKRLSNLGADFIRLSDDKFHEAGGVKLKKVRELKSLEKEVNIEIKYLIQESAVAFGKAEKLEEKDLCIMNCMNKKTSLENPYVFLDINGDAYICTWKCAPNISNLITDSFDEFEKELKTDFNQLILAGEIEKAVNLDGKTELEKLSNIEYAKLKGQCMLCKKKFQNGK